MELFLPDGQFLRGNLHTHTTVSDGARTPDEVCELYRGRGYDFLALTDHNKYAPGGMYDEMILLSGIELAYNNMDTRRAYHFVGIGSSESVGAISDTRFGCDPQRIIDHIRAAGGYTILAHPAWSLLSPEDALPLTGFDAIEIMNTVSDPGARGDSSSFTDILMARGCPKALVASDDTHFYNGDECKSFVMASVRERSGEGVMEALRAGRFYASQGPLFRSIRFEDGYIHVSCSPVKIIRFMSDAFYAPNRRHICDLKANAASYKINANDNFVRVECADAEGRRAWSGYIDVRQKNK